MSTAAPPASGSQPVRPSVEARQLTWVLAWAVVFCDIGTSVYYVPGILFEQVGEMAPVFVAMVTVGFLLLSIKYIESCWRNPEGGGVVTVAIKAFGPRWGALGGMLITVDYFLTSSISSTSAFYYIGSVFPVLEEHVVVLACIGIAALAVLNVIGIRESAMVALWMAVAALATDAWVIGQTLWRLGPSAFRLIGEVTDKAHELSPKQVLIGFSGAWLAFSGLESIAQLSPTIKEPLRGNARRAMILLMVTVGITAPLLTLFSVALLTPANTVDTERFISELGLLVGGTTLKVAVVLTATTLLLFAANTAMIGGYHIFLALGSNGFFPRAILTRNRAFGTPHVAIAITTIVPMIVIWATNAQMVVLGEMYAFGLLGAFLLESFGLDVIRWRLLKRGPNFYLGVFTSLLLLVAFSVNLFAKPLATFFGGGITLFGMGLALGVREGKFAEWLYLLPFVGRAAQERAEEAERQAERKDIEIVSLAQAAELRPLFPSTTLLAIRGRASSLIREAVARVKGNGESALYCVFVDEMPGLFLSNEPPEPNPEAESTLHAAMVEAKRHGVELIPIWMISFSAADAIARAAEALEVDGVMVGVSRRSALYRLLRGQVVKGLARRLPRNCHLLLVN